MELSVERLEDCLRWRNLKSTLHEGTLVDKIGIFNFGSPQLQAFVFSIVQTKVLVVTHTVIVTRILPVLVTNRWGRIDTMTLW